MSVRKTVGVAALVGPALLAVGLVVGAQTPAQPRQFGADYDGLTEVQRALVDDIYRRVGVIIGQTLDPKDAYDRTPQSLRTTFDAVTNALAASSLTDRDTGEALGRPIDLVDHLETVAGQKPGMPGDEQFRLYVVLKPEAVDRLARSKEFRRTADNTIFHKGYPTSYRQDGYPSVQFSIAKDGTRADIDVDYRSSRFPAALVNGHLTAANSDVRAGNYERHTAKWSGLVNWWEGFVAALFSARTYDTPDEERAFPVVPRAGDSTIDVAVDDFLTTWLVEDRPNVALAYVDRDAYQCLALRLEEEGGEMDRGLAGFQLYMRMKAVDDAVGPRKSLEGTVTGIRLTNPDLKLVDHRKRGQYSIYGVPQALAERMTCASYTTLGELPPAQVNRFERQPIDTFYTTFFIAGANGEEAPLGLLWQKRDGFWKIVSYQRGGDTGAGTDMPDIRPKAEPVVIPRVSGDPDLIAANERFLDAWLVGKRYDEAFDYFSPRCYACINLYLDPGEAAAETADAERARLRAGVERLGERAGRIARLEDIITGVEPADPRVRVVEHPRERAYAILALPDWAGPVSDCAARLARGDTPAAEPEGGGAGFGRYYATAMQFLTRAGATAVLYLGWTREDGAWRIYAFKVVEP